MTPVYTDGSGINGKVGAAALTRTFGWQSYLGKTGKATVYAAEIVGIHIALDIILDHIAGQQNLNINDNSGEVSNRNHRQYIIYTDNQAAIRTVSNGEAKSAQYIAERVIQAIDTLRHLYHQEIEIHWIPAHKGVRGNERADRAAKEATGWYVIDKKEHDSPRTANRYPDTKPLRTSISMTINTKMKARWEEEWRNERTGRSTHKLTPIPTSKLLNLYKNVPKAVSSVIIQMRTGKIGLRACLYKWKVPEIDNAHCTCDRGDQTLKHVLLQCHRFRKERRQTLRSLQTNDISMILNDPDMVKKAAKFMIQTGLLGQFKAVRSILREAEEVDSLTR